MNGIYMFIKRLELYFIKNRLVFCIFLLGGIINTIAILYCYGNLLPTVANKNSQDTIYTSYSISFAGLPTEIGTLVEFAKDPLIKNCAFTNGAVCTYIGDYPLAKLSGSTDFTGEYQCIVPALADVSVGDKVDYYSKEFVVIGSASYGMDVPIIPHQTYMELCETEGIIAIDLHASKRQDPQNDQVVSLINKYFPYKSHMSASNQGVAYAESRQSEQFLLLIVINAFFAVLSHTFTLHYLLDSHRNENIIATFVGASKSRIATYVLSDAVILSMVTNFVGIIIHKLFYSSIFIKLNLTADIKYSLGDYCFCYLIIILLSILAAIPVVFNIAYLTPSVARRKAL